MDFLDQNALLAQRVFKRGLIAEDFLTHPLEVLLKLFDFGRNGDLIGKGRICLSIIGKGIHSAADTSQVPQDERIHGQHRNAEAGQPHQDRKKDCR